LVKVDHHYTQTVLFGEEHNCATEAAINTFHITALCMNYLALNL